MKLEISKQIVGEFKAIADKAMGKIVIHGRSIDEITPEMAMNGEYTYDDYEKAQEELRARERQEKHRQQRQELKRIEHLVRAIREEEGRVLPEWKEKCRAEDDALRAQCLSMQETKAREQYQKAVACYEAFVGIRDLVEGWVADRMAHRQDEYGAQVHERLTKLEAVLKEEKIQRARKRREEAVVRKREEDIERKKQEEERRRRDEEEARARTAEKQRMKDLEIEERLRSGPAAPAPAPTAPPRAQSPVEIWRGQAAAAAAPAAAAPTPVRAEEQPPVAVAKPAKYIPPRGPGGPPFMVRPAGAPAAAPPAVHRPAPVDTEMSWRRPAEPAPARQQAAPPAAARRPSLNDDGFTTVTKKQRPAKGTVAK